ncbi:uncharacterized protein LOC131311374 isoform X2 [Rhododendron vialii]|uniref:uncharacterized protein LOC131311374 isoform X2 n=1 Tax=Rhododendron vialii TaxID=182163 RepID=UPI00265F4EED|nr:uncharacterized protein LOC131311374 isoform X2 [Rhododendron vialii]
MEENMAASTTQPSSSPPLPSPEESTKSKHQQNGTESPSASTPPPPSVTRLWRPVAQRNLRNQWSKMASYNQEWSSSSSSARYMNAMELGVLSDMPDIRKKACWKLFKQQDLHRRKLLSSYKDMVAVLVLMVNTSRSMRSFIKGTSSPLVQFSSFSEDKNDNGDGGGIPVYTFWSISSFEGLAYELVQMFRLELNLKRLLVVELLSISSDEVSINRVCWLDELYTGEFDDLCICDLYSKEVGEPVRPKIEGWKSDTSAEQSNCQPDQDVLQVYLTTWLAEVNIDTYRVDEIFATVGEEMHVSLT